MDVKSRQFWIRELRFRFQAQLVSSFPVCTWCPRWEYYIKRVLSNAFFRQPLQKYQLQIKSFHSVICSFASRAASTQSSKMERMRTMNVSRAIKKYITTNQNWHVSQLYFSSQTTLCTEVWLLYILCLKTSSRIAVSAFTSLCYHGELITIH